MSGRPRPMVCMTYKTSVRWQETYVANSGRMRRGDTASIVCGRSRMRFKRVVSSPLSKSTLVRTTTLIYSLVPATTFLDFMDRHHYRPAHIHLVVSLPQTFCPEPNLPRSTTFYSLTLKPGNAPRLLDSSHADLPKRRPIPPRRRGVRCGGVTGSRICSSRGRPAREPRTGVRCPCRSSSGRGGFIRWNAIEGRGE